jgi:hypothetical protein
LLATTEASPTILPAGNNTNTTISSNNHDLSAGSIIDNLPYLTGEFIRLGKVPSDKNIWNYSTSSEDQSISSVNLTGIPVPNIKTNLAQPTKENNVTANVSEDTAVGNASATTENRIANFVTKTGVSIDTNTLICTTVNFVQNSCIIVTASANSNTKLCISPDNVRGVTRPTP